MQSGREQFPRDHRALWSLHTMSTALSEDEVRAFVGDNADYYVQAWAPALSGQGRGSRFNGAAFLVPVL
jgi:hypothetical protein